MLAEDIRKFVFENNIKPARMVGVKIVSVNAGAVHTAMGLTSRMPAVCGAIGANTFCATYGVKLLSRSGPQNGATATFTYSI